MSEKAFARGQRVGILGDRAGTVIEGPLVEYRSAYLVAVDGEGLSVVASFAMSLLPVVPAEHGDEAARAALVFELEKPLGGMASRCGELREDIENLLIEFADVASQRIVADEIVNRLLWRDYAELEKLRTELAEAREWADCETGVIHDIQARTAQALTPAERWREADRACTAMDVQRPGQAALNTLSILRPDLTPPRGAWNDGTKLGELLEWTRAHAFPAPHNCVAALDEGPDVLAGYAKTAPPQPTPSGLQVAPRLGEDTQDEPTGWTSRVWNAGDPEPLEEGLRLMGRDSRYYREDEWEGDEYWFRSDGMWCGPWSLKMGWNTLLAYQAPLVEYRRQAASEPSGCAQ
ncbi:hypothetical protein ABZ863_01765 [Saccharomonospora sp. NPDC046836]|uniref:hypothetical protein n=1 Tax=Saccharomonospora sp. NPDC046836 TaxID=3156921 RepID=UPI0033E320FB